MAAGDVVELKSGGPSMTIKWIKEDDAWCEWFDGKKAEGRKFALVSLKKLS